MNKQEFFDFLSHFDWTYAMSDDHRVWTRGEEANARKNNILKSHPEWRDMHDAFYNWGWRKPNSKKPTLGDFLQE